MGPGFESLRGNNLGEVAQLVEHVKENCFCKYSPYGSQVKSYFEIQWKDGVSGSNPFLPTIKWSRSIKVMHETFNFGKKERYLPGSPNNGNIAQLVEQGAVNAQVVGSEPTIPAKYWEEVGLEAAIF